MAARAETRAEPLTFTIANGDYVSPTFTLPFVPAGPLLDVSAAMLTGGLEIVVAFGRFLYDTLSEDQHDALRDALLHVDLPVARDIATWIIEQAVARPLGSAASSEDGPSNNGSVSKLAAASIGWTPSE